MARPQAIEPISGDAYIRMCIYGENGVGKTPLIARAKPKVLIIDADGGTESAVGSGAERWRVKDWNDMTEALEYMQIEGHKVYHWWWLDSITGMQTNGIAHIMADLVAAKPHRKVWQVDQGEVGQNMSRIKDWFRQAASVPCHFGMTAHPFHYMDEWSEEDPADKMWPYVQGRNMPQTIMGYMNVIGYMARRNLQSGETAPVLYVGGLTNAVSRDRFGALPDKIIRPDMTKIEEAISKKITTEAPPSRPAGAAVSSKKLPTKKVAAPVRKAIKRSN